MTMLEVEQILGRPDRIEVEEGRIDGNVEHPKVIRWVYSRYRVTESGEGFGNPGHVNFVPFRFTELGWNDRDADEVARKYGEQSDVFRTYSIRGSFPIASDQWEGPGLLDAIPEKDIK
jgi:hypothetical protein